MGEVFGEVGLGGKIPSITQNKQRNVLPQKSAVGMVREVVSPSSASETIKNIVDFLLGLDEI